MNPIPILLISILLGSCSTTFTQDETKCTKWLNVILVLTDDQGIDDLGCHGNPWFKTPNIDAFYKEAVRLTDFHVSPVLTQQEVQS